MLNIKVSKDAVKQLTRLSKSSGLSKDKALVWLIMETAMPTIDKRSKVARTESLKLKLSESALEIVTLVAERYKVSADAVVDAYLARGY